MAPASLFRDRRQAGRELARSLGAYEHRLDAVVLALPRGGVPVGFEVAQALDLPLDVFVVRKLGLPGHEEFAIGAVASGGVRVLDEEVVRHFGLGPGTLEAITHAEARELERRERIYRGDAPEPELHARTVILVDDGLAAGASLHAAVRALQARAPRRVIVAVPTAAPETCEDLRQDSAVDELVCAITPAPFHAASPWYEDFRQTTDAEVMDLMARARDRVGESRPEHEAH